MVVLNTPGGPLRLTVPWDRSTHWAFKVVLGGYPRCPDNQDLSKCHCLYDFVIDSCIKAAPDCQISSPSYQVNSLNFDSEKNSVITP